MKQATIDTRPSRRPFAKRVAGILLLCLISLWGGAGCSTEQPETLTGTTVIVLEDSNIKATLATRSGFLREGPNEFMLEFRTPQGTPVDVGAITLYFDMPAMGSMPYMKNDAQLTTTSTPGLYRGTVTLEMKGTWQAKLGYAGQAGNGTVTGTINAR